MQTRLGRRNACAAGAMFTVFFACLWACLGGAHAEDRMVLTADEAVRLGLEGNARTIAARADVAEARAAYDVARAGQLPRVRTMASYTRLLGDISEPDLVLVDPEGFSLLESIPRDQISMEIRVEQPLTAIARLRKLARSAAHRAESAELLAVHEEVELAYEIRQAYWNLYAAVGLRAALDAAVAEAEERVRETVYLVNEGAALRADLAAARTRRSEALLDQVEAENLVRLLQIEMNYLIGLPFDMEVEPVGDPGSAPAAAESSGADPGALDAHPQLRALGEQVLAQRFEVEAAQARWIPDVDIWGGFLYARPNPYMATEFDRFRGLGSLGMRFNWDPWDAGRSASTREAHARLRAAEARLEEARNQASVALARQLLEMERTQKALEVAVLHVEEIEEALRVARQQFGEGMLRPVQLMNAERSVLFAYASRSQAVADHAMARAALLHVRGLVW